MLGCLGGGRKTLFLFSVSGLGSFNFLMNSRDLSVYTKWFLCNSVIFYRFYPEIIGGYYSYSISSGISGKFDIPTSSSYSTVNYYSDGISQSESSLCFSATHWAFWIKSEGSCWRVVTRSFMWLFDFSLCHMPVPVVRRASPSFVTELMYGTRFIGKMLGGYSSKKLELSSPVVRIIILLPVPSC